jgi:multiple sugar transport system ATP-binding protein
MKDNAMTVKDVAGYLKLSPQMVYNMVRYEELPAFKVGHAVRILSGDLDLYVKNQKTLFKAKNSSIATRGVENQVTVNHLCARQGSFKLVDIDFSLPFGASLGVLGPSGAGKTLLLRTLAGLVKPDLGTMFIGRERMDDAGPESRRIGYVFQDYALYPMTSRENIAFPREIAGNARKIVDETVEKVAARLKIPKEYLDKESQILPKGIRQLVAIGRAENREASLFLMDEPLVHLDPAQRRQMRVFLAALRKEVGATTVYGFNDPEDALALSDYLMILIDGRATQYGPLEQVYEHPAGLREMEMLSLTGVNRLRVSVKGGRSSPWGIEAPVADGEWLCCFRPEEIELGEGPFRANVERIAPKTGSEGIAEARLDSGEALRLVLPLDSPKKLNFKPLSPRFFPPES